MKTIIISAGHNPSKSGASWKGTREHDEATKWINEIEAYLIKQVVKVVRVPTGSLTQKVKTVNRVSRAQQSIAVELHFNSAGEAYVQGNETLHHPSSVAGKALAESFNGAFMERAQRYVVKDRGVKAGWYRMDRPGIIDFYGDEDGDEMPVYWLRATACPALILEPCFMCQLSDIEDDWITVAHAIADSLIIAAV